MSVNGTDINNDGSVDLVIGNYAGGIAMYLGDTTALGVAEHQKPTFNLSLFPNPSVGYLNISLSNLPTNALIALSIYNILGEEVFSVHGLRSKGTSQTLSTDVSILPQGIYSCRVRATSQNSDSFSSQKLVIFR